MAVARFREAFPKKARSGCQSSPPHGPGAGPALRAADPTNVSGVTDAVDQRCLPGISGSGPTANDDESGTDEALRAPAKGAARSHVHDAVDQRRLAGISIPGPDADDESGTDEALWAHAQNNNQQGGPDDAEGFHQLASQPRTGPVTRADQRVDSL